MSKTEIAIVEKWFGKAGIYPADPQTIRKYWFGITAECDWKPGSPWCLEFEDSRTADTGEILEAVPPKRLVLRWRNEFKPELKAEGYSRCTMEIEMADYYPDSGGKAVKLTITHELEGEGAKFIEAVSGWLAKGPVEPQVAARDRRCCVSEVISDGRCDEVQAEDGLCHLHRCAG
jgi:uncharacterized protein YndB with AHSA1/START domain